MKLKNRKAVEKINEAKSLFLEKIDKLLGKPPA